jgi:hypothetical protein
LEPPRIQCYRRSSKKIQIQFRVLYLSYAVLCVIDSASAENWSKSTFYYPCR